ncbi:uncharacterized protein LOC134657461 [Cydia amplana]|uniref:uncharacterized protein LOC134657461 n=1 Tax=Cydia amplana TaxID=1869771 RepID=UPI002FE5C830
MDLLLGTDQKRLSRSEWRFAERGLLVITYIFLLILQNNCQTVLSNETSQIENLTKRIDSLGNKVESKQCHSCQSSNKFENKNVESNEESENFIDNMIETVGEFTEKLLLVNRTEKQLENELERIVDDALRMDRFVIIDGVEIKSMTKRDSRKLKDEAESRALFSTYTYEYRLLQKIKNFVETHIISINLPKAARFITFRSFGLKKLFVPLLFGAQLFKGMLLAMFLPSILGSFGKILGKGISQLSASSSQASNPPAVDDQTSYSNDQKDFMAYETDPTGAYAYPQDGMYVNVDPADVNDLSNVDMSRFGTGGHKVAYLPTKNGYYKNQLASATNNYKVFQKIPASSMILSNYDPFYSPLLSRLDGIFARLGLAPSENTMDTGAQVGGQSLSDVKLESCREQLICLMYASPAKYAPYSNLVSAQLSRELNELRRPVSDNPEILRFFRYMRAARRGQEGVDCARAHPGCAASTPQHTMIAAYHDINKLVTARKLKN